MTNGAYWDGYAACIEDIENKEEKYNPHKVETREYHDWESGYQDARFDECLEDEHLNMESTLGEDSDASTNLRLCG